MQIGDLVYAKKRTAGRIGVITKTKSHHRQGKCITKYKVYWVVSQTQGYWYDDTEIGSYLEKSNS